MAFAFTHYPPHHGLAPATTTPSFFCCCAALCHGSMVLHGALHSMHTSRARTPTFLLPASSFLLPATYLLTLLSHPSFTPLLPATARPVPFRYHTSLPPFHCPLPTYHLCCTTFAFSFLHAHLPSHTCIFLYQISSCMPAMLAFANTTVVTCYATRRAGAIPVFRGVNVPYLPTDFLPAGGSVPRRTHHTWVPTYAAPKVHGVQPCAHCYVFPGPTACIPPRPNAYI